MSVPIVTKYKQPSHNRIANINEAMNIAYYPRKYGTASISPATAYTLAITDLPATWIVANYNSKSRRTNKMTKPCTKVIKRETTMPPKTHDTLIDYVSSLRKKYNWNGSGANAISQKAVNKASQVVKELISTNLPQPGRVSPTKKGTIAFEWHAKTFLLFIEIDKKGDIRYQIVYDCLPMEKGVIGLSGINGLVSQTYQKG